MAVSFRERFDFSSPDHFDQLCDMSFKTADALLKRAAEDEAKLRAKEAKEAKPNA